MTKTQEYALRDYWWVLLIFFLLVGGWVSLPFLRGTGEDSVAIEREGDSGEQSLRALESSSGASGQAQGTGRGAATDPSGRPYSAAVDASGLRLGGAADPSRSRTASAAKPGAEGGASRTAATGGDTLAEALKNVSESGSGGADPSGRLRRSSLGAGSGAFAASGTGAPGGSGVRSSDGGAEGTSLLSGRGGRRSFRSEFGRGQAFGALEQAAKASEKALVSKDEMAAHFGKKAFDLAPRRAATIIASGSGEAGGPPRVNGDVPVSLTTGEPELGSPEFVPPVVGPAAETREKNQQYMEQQLLMMILAVSLGGLLGPALGTAGVELVRSYGLNPPTGDAMHKFGDPRRPT